MDSLSTRSSMRSQSCRGGDGGSARGGAGAGWCRRRRARPAAQAQHSGCSSPSAAAATHRRHRPPQQQQRRRRRRRRRTISRSGRRLLSTVGWMYCSATNSMRPSPPVSSTRRLAIQRARKRGLGPGVGGRQAVAWSAGWAHPADVCAVQPHASACCATIAQPQPKPTTHAPPARVHGLVAERGRRQKVGQVAGAGGGARDGERQWDAKRWERQAALACSAFCAALVLRPSPWSNGPPTASHLMFSG